MDNDKTDEQKKSIMFYKNDAIFYIFGFIIMKIRSVVCVCVFGCIYICVHKLRACVRTFAIEALPSDGVYTLSF